MTLSILFHFIRKRANDVMIVMLRIAVFIIQDVIWKDVLNAVVNLFHVIASDEVIFLPRLPYCRC